MSYASSRARASSLIRTDFSGADIPSGSSSTCPKPAAAGSVSGGSGGELGSSTSAALFVSASLFACSALTSSSTASVSVLLLFSKDSSSCIWPISQVSIFSGVCPASASAASGSSSSNLWSAANSVFVSATPTCTSGSAAPVCSIFVSAAPVCSIFVSAADVCITFLRGPSGGKHSINQDLISSSILADTVCPTWLYVEKCTLHPAPRRKSALFKASSRVAM
mmetsp:Transcript_124191/g.220052  ORF Transcript_124191/g.220052 Transcript_124191/m.220052 type:complete len:222 (-) Transcript_124191:106-771(-)